MANIKSAKKRIRQIERRTAVNRNRVSRVRTYIKKVELAIGSGNAEAAREAFRQAEPEIMRSARRGGLHRNTAARTISRLNRRIKALGA